MYKLVLQLPGKKGYCKIKTTVEKTVLECAINKLAPFVKCSCSFTKVIAILCMPLCRSVLNFGELFKLIFFIAFEVQIVSV